uniref:Auxin efflux carrier component n=1 Tax=Populus alba TaxID=43335 RepID=A0A4U5R592_POPAL|nr:hypothetical protein D5086_0000013210 [Populus alba]
MGIGKGFLMRFLSEQFDANTTFHDLTKQPWGEHIKREICYKGFSPRRKDITILEPLVVMISTTDVYHVVAATVPLYFVMILAYISYQSLQNEPETHIRRLSSKTTRPFSADSARQNQLSRRLNWIITGLSLSTLPNTFDPRPPPSEGYVRSRGRATSLADSWLAEPDLVQFCCCFCLSSMPPRKPLWHHLQELQEIERIFKNHNTKKERKCKAEQRGRRLGMAMFSLGMITIYHQHINTPSSSVPVTRILIPSKHSTGLFMALRPSIISCGIRMAVVAMAMKFVAGPALMAVASFAVRLEGTVLRVAIVQAALPQGIVPFVFAKEYNVHPDTLSTGVIFGMLIAMPIALAYYSLLAL